MLSERSSEAGKGRLNRCPTMREGGKEKGGRAVLQSWAIILLEEKTLIYESVGRPRLSYALLPRSVSKKMCERLISRR